ncbi:MAG: histidinol-phosphate transaminase, partial [Flavobacteriales bacterium]
NILVTNGSTEAFYLAAKYFENTSATIPVPTFAEYKDAAKIHRLSLNLIDRFELDPNAPVYSNLFFLCNPNNPTGDILKPSEIEKLLENNPDTTFLIDEANIELINEEISSIPLIEKFNNIIIVRSLTKAYAIPGLRLGYIIARPELIEKLIANKMPWSVNTLALKAGEYIIDNLPELHLDPALLISNTQKLKNNIDKLEGMCSRNSNTGYFLVELKKGKASELKSFLIENHGILIRDAGNFDGLDDRFVRISTQSASENKLLLNALKEWTHSI